VVPQAIETTWISASLGGSYWNLAAAKARDVADVAFHEKCGIAIGTIRPRVAERISFDKVAESHRRIEAGGSDGKLVLCPELLP
jgi:NADPH:quinone reductase-like Zn-dependent oxidoreductase